MRGAELDRAGEDRGDGGEAGFVGGVEPGGFGLSRSNTASNWPARTMGTTSSLTEAASQAMWPGKAWTSSTRWTSSVAAAVPHTPLPNGMRMQAGRPWNGPRTSSPPTLR